MKKLSKEAFIKALSNDETLEFEPDGIEGSITIKKLSYKQTVIIENTKIGIEQLSQAVAFAVIDPETDQKMFTRADAKKAFENVPLDTGLSILKNIMDFSKGFELPEGDSEEEKK